MCRTIQTLVAVVLAWSIACFALSVPAAALDAQTITAATAVLVDAETGQVLFDKDMDVQRAPASITKVMTGLLVMEACDAEDIVTVSPEAVDLPYGVSHIALMAGEQISVNDLMYALMLPSANDAANALAEHVAGSQDAFVDQMNRRAEELGATHTHFCNPSGLPEDDHVTTAHDMAIITSAAIQNEDFLRYFGVDRYTIPATNLQSEQRPLTNQMYMLLEDQDWCYNPDVIGGKVGYTDEAMHTMTTAAQKDGRTLVAVVLGCTADNKFYDTQALLDYGFGDFSPVEIPDKLCVTEAMPVKQNGDTVGSAVFRAEAANTMLLPGGLDADDIQVEYHLPDTLEYDGDLAASMTLTADGAPGVSLEVPMTAQITLNEGVTLPPADGRGLVHKPIWAMVLLALPVLALLFLLQRYYHVQKKRRRYYLRKTKKYSLQQKINRRSS